MADYKSYHNLKLPKWNESHMRNKGFKGAAVNAGFREYCTHSFSHRLPWIDGKISNSEIVNYVNMKDKSIFCHKRLLDLSSVKELNRKLEGPDKTGQAVTGFIPTGMLVAILYTGLSIAQEKLYKNFDFRARKNDQAVMVETLWATNPPSSDHVVVCKQYCLRDKYRKQIFPISFETKKLKIIF